VAAAVVDDVVAVATEDAIGRSGSTTNAPRSLRRVLNLYASAVAIGRTGGGVGGLPVGQRGDVVRGSVGRQRWQCRPQRLRPP